jgi:hypothetical protein
MFMWLLAVDYPHTLFLLLLLLLLLLFHNELYI